MKTLIGAMTVLLVTLGLTPLLQAEDAKVDFVKQIAPILKRSCVKCHGGNPQKRPKGKLNLTKKDGPKNAYREREDDDGNKYKDIDPATPSWMCATSLRNRASIVT